MKSPYSSWCREARLLPLFIPLMLVACSDGDSPTGGAGDASTTLSVYLTDAPGDVSRVWLEISSITTTGSGGTVELLTQPTDLIEVTALTDEAVALVQALDFDPGSVQTLRFVIGGAVLETNDGKVFTRNGALHPEGIESGGELQCPSCSQSGIKVRLSKVLTVAEGENGVLLDFDVSRSFGRQVGNSGRWVMSPVVHGASKNPNEVELGLSDLEIRGSIVLAAGVQIPVCAGAQRSLADFVPVAVATTLVDDTGEPVSFNGKSDGEGEVEIEVLEGDTYTLSFAEVVEFESGSLSFSGRVTPAQVNVGEDNPTVVGVIFTIESVSCAEAAPAPAMVTVLLIDAPGDVSRVWVDVLGITGKGPEGLKVTLLDEPTGLIELTALTDEAMTLVEALEMAPGPLNQLRFVIGGAVLETEDGKIFVRDGAVHPEGLEATGELKCPGCSASGVKVSLSRDLSIEEGVNGILLDFDVGQSFGKQAGSSGKWVMKPVLHGAKRNPGDVGDEDDSFQIRGTVALAEGVVIPACDGVRSIVDFVPLATALTLVDEEGAPVVVSGLTKTQGTFKIKVLEADGYALTFVEEVEFEGENLVFEATVDPAEVTVEEGMPPAEAAYEITAATCVVI